MQPDVAVFGQKDYQQQLVIRRMVDDLNLPIKILTVPTVREPDGLAMSSRNAYLEESERDSASVLHACLRGIEKQLIGGARDFPLPMTAGSRSSRA